MYREGRLPPFKLDLIVELVLADRFAEAQELAEVSSFPFGRGLALATALSVAGPSVTGEALRDAASRLVDAVDGIQPGPLADPALGATMRTLTSGGLHDEAARLAQKLVLRPGLWSAVGIWALDRARAGEVDQVRALVRQLLVERPMPTADAGARAVVLAAVAGRRGSASDELEAAAVLLSDVRVAAAEWLEKAVGSAFTLARRGELAPFGRLCQALLELLPPDRAVLTWARWLVAAASAGANEALRLIATYVRWIPEDDLTNVVVNAQTGQLHSR